LVQAGEAVRATLTGTLTMGGVEKPITFDADVIAGDSGVVEVGGSVDVNMKDFGLKPPSLMLGTMKVRELVNVRFELLLQQ
jgi:polyisoprenoid-binding protein YceI